MVFVLFLGCKYMQRKCRDNMYKFTACVHASGVIDSIELRLQYPTHVKCLWPGLYTLCEGESAATP